MSCVACGEGGRGQTMIKAMNKLYHVLCFRCSDCQQQLQSFYRCNERPYCAECIDGAEARAGHHRGNTCARCTLPVRSGVVVTALGVNWHQDCFYCGVCGCDLSDGFYSFAGEPYCKQHIAQVEHRSKSAAATYPVSGDTLVESTNAKAPHEGQDKTEKDCPDNPEEVSLKSADSARVCPPSSLRQQEREITEEVSLKSTHSAEPEVCAQQKMESPREAVAAAPHTAYAASDVAAETHDCCGCVGELKRQLRRLEKELAAQIELAKAATSRALLAEAPDVDTSASSSETQPLSVAVPQPPPPPPFVDMSAPRKLVIRRTGQRDAIGRVASRSNQAEVCQELARLAVHKRRALRRVAARPSRHNLTLKRTRLKHREPVHSDTQVQPQAQADSAHQAAQQAQTRLERLKSGHPRIAVQPSDRIDDFLEDFDPFDDEPSWVRK